MDRDYIETTIISTMQKIAQDQGIAPLDLQDETVLLDSGLDSMSFATVVVTLEEELGEDPFLATDEVFYPTTLRDFMDFYIKYFLEK